MIYDTETGSVRHQLYSNEDSRRWQASEDILHMDNHHNILAVAERSKIMLWNMANGQAINEIEGF